MNKINKFENNIAAAIEGGIELRLFSPTYHYTPYRPENINHNKLEINFSKQKNGNN
jgi:hypothetical protein